MCGCLCGNAFVDVGVVCGRACVCRYVGVGAAFFEEL